MPLVKLGEIPGNGQLVNRPLPVLPYRGDLSRDLSRNLNRDLSRDLSRELNRELPRDLSRDLLNSNELPKRKPQSLLHTLPQSASIPSTPLSTASLPQLPPINSALNSPIGQAMNPSLIPTTMSPSINSISQTIASTLNSPLTTMNSKMPAINPLIPPPINTHSPTLSTSSILNKQVPSCTITRSSISSLCKSPSGKQEPYNVQVNLMQTQAALLPTSSLRSASTGVLSSAFAELNTSLSNSLSGLQANQMNAFIPVHLNGHQSDASNSEHNLESFNANSPICMANVLTDDEIQKVAKHARKALEMMKAEVEAVEKMKMKNQKKVKDVKVSTRSSATEPLDRGRFA